MLSLLLTTVVIGSGLMECDCHMMLSSTAALPWRAQAFPQLPYGIRDNPVLWSINRTHRWCPPIPIPSASSMLVMLNLDCAPSLNTQLLAPGGAAIPCKKVLHKTPALIVRVCPVAISVAV